MLSVNKKDVGEKEGGLSKRYIITLNKNLHLTYYGKRPNARRSSNDSRVFILSRWKSTDCSRDGRRRPD